MWQVCNCDCNTTEFEGKEVVKDPVNYRVPEPALSEWTMVEKDAGSKLTLEIVGASGLRNTDWWPGYGKSDCYCVVKCRGNTVHTTKVIADCLEPQWRETVAVDWEEGQSLEFHIFDKDVCTSRFLGKAILESQSFATEGFNDVLQVAEAGEGISAFLRLKIKVPGKDFPSAPPTSFEIEVGKGGASAWGLDFDMQDKKILCVVNIKAGPFQLYNQEAPREKQLMKHDFIKSVNGVEGDTQAMLSQFQAQKQVKVVVVRSVEVTVCLDLTDPSTVLGMKVSGEPNGNHLMIFELLDSGAIPDYNRKAPDDAQKIMKGDRITAVKGVKGGGAYVMNEFTKTRGKMQVTLLRPAMEK